MENATLVELKEESINSTEDAVEEVFNHDEFFQSKEDVPVSESYICKKILYSSIGTTNVKAFDIFLLIPSLIFLLFLIYTSPRSRQKMSGAPTGIVQLKFIVLLSTVTSLLRALLLIAVPTEKDSSNALEKVTWSLTRSCLVCLELTTVLNLIFSTPPNAKNSRRLFGGIVLASTLYFILTLLIELGVPSAAYHLFEMGYYLYGEGGGLYTAIVSALFLALHTLVLSVRLREHKSCPGRTSALICSFSLIGLHSLRVLGGLILLTGLQGGMCLTSLTLYVHTVVLGPLVFFCLVSPFLRNGQGHSLLAYSIQNNEWEDDELNVNDKLNNGAGILKNENAEEPELHENEDDYTI